MPKQLKEFTDFVREQGVVGLAVGLAIGLVASGAVNTIVDKVINPIVGFILGGSKLSDKAWHSSFSHNGYQLVIGWGAVLNSIIILLATALVIFYVVRIFRLDRLDKKKDE